MASKIKSFMSTILSCSKSNKLFLRGQKKEKQNFPYSRVCVCVCVCVCPGQLAPARGFCSDGLRGEGSASAWQRNFIVASILIRGY